MNDRRSTLSAVVLIIIAFMVASAISGCTQGGTIKGRVIDGEGNPVGDAGVILFKNEEELESVETANDGSYSFTGLEPGQYSFAVDLIGTVGTELKGSWFVKAKKGETVKKNLRLNKVRMP